jgi:hypothetical protein
MDTALKLLLVLWILFSSVLCFAEAERPEAICTEIAFSEDPWGDEGNFCADDGSYAYATYTGQISYLTNFDFVIPHQATITGVVVKAETQKTSYCRVTKPGASTMYVTPDSWVTSAFKTFTATQASWTVSTLGSSADLWSLQWNPIDFNNNTFQVGIKANLVGTWACEAGYSREIWCDYISAIIYYKMPDSPYIYNTEIQLMR